MSDEFELAALDYLRSPRSGKLAVVTTKPMETQRDLSLAYSPGVAVACEAIRRDPSEAFSPTGRQDLVGVITNGTAVLGLGDIGPLASKPVMEGKAALFKKFAGIDAPDLEVEGEMHGDAAHIAYSLLKVLDGGITVGPILLGLAKSAHVVTQSITVAEAQLGARKRLPV